MTTLPLTAQEREMLKLDNQLCFQIYTASRLMVQAYRPLLKRLELTYPQYLVMLVLWEQADRALTVTAIGHRLALDSGTLTPLLKRLEQRGLIARKRGEQDERQVNIQLTEAGSALSKTAAHVPVQLMCSVGMPIGDLVALKEQLEGLVNQLKDALD